MEFDLVIVGSGLAGYGLVEEVRQYCKKMSILLLTQDDGAHYHKPALSTGFSKSLSAKAMIEKTSLQIARDFNIKIKTFTTVDEIIPLCRQLRAAGVTYSYKNLVLATGASPIRLPWPNDVNPKVFHINNLHDYQLFSQKMEGKSRIAVIGSGLVGSEYANDLAMAGKHINVISMDERLLQNLVPKPISNALQTCLEELGIKFNLESNVCSSRMNEDEEIELTLSDGQILKVDLIISAVGLSPNFQLAANANIEVEHGIRVSKSLQTSAENVYAIGDCAEISGSVNMYLIPLNLSIKALAKTLTKVDDTASNVNFGVIPVLVKTPSCGIVCVPPTELKGQWRVEGTAPHLKAEYLDEQGRLNGFALSGKKLLERMKMLRRLESELS